MSHTHWNILSSGSKPVAMADIHPLILQLLHNRGITEPSQIELFLRNDSAVEADPFLLPDMHRAVHRIHQALMKGEKIVIYGDFDADGITATALLVQGIEALGGTVIPYIPHRTQEGYGLRVSALKEMHEQGISLVITVDTGISANNEVEKGQKMGMDIIVTDHHIPPAILPPALAIINPKRKDSKYPFIQLAGVGVAFKLLQALTTGDGRENIARSAMDLVALGTVTDMVPLTGENRYWVKSGLEIINKSQRLGLQEMIRGTRLQSGNLDAQSISWVLGPRINAAGRIDNATTSYQLLLTEDPQEANSLALELESKNAERIKQTNELTNKARKAIEVEGVDQPLLLAGDKDYPPGIMGLVAGRLADKFYRPVILLRFGQETCRGSGRSIIEFDLMSALTECQDLLTNFGGHTMAAGFSVPTSKLPEFQQRISSLARNKLAGLDLRPHINIDAEVKLDIFNRATYESIQQLAPFGSGNPLPTFVSRRVEVTDLRQIGNQGEHLKFRVKHNGITWDTIGFGLGDYSKEITGKLDIVFNLDIDRWNGEEKLRLNLLDFDPVE